MQQKITSHAQFLFAKPAGRKISKRHINSKSKKSTSLVPNRSQKQPRNQTQFGQEPPFPPLCTKYIRCSTAEMQVIFSKNAIDKNNEPPCGHMRCLGGMSVQRSSPVAQQKRGYRKKSRHLEGSIGMHSCKTKTIY